MGSIVFLRNKNATLIGSSMSIFSRAQHASTLNLIVAIESGSVSVAIVHTTETNGRTFLFSTSRSFMGEAQTGSELLSRMGDALRRACDDIQKEGLTHIIHATKSSKGFATITILYGAPWYVSRGRTVTLKEATGRTITKRFLAELIEAHSAEMLPSEFAHAVIIERDAQAFTVNGYPVKTPIGMTGETLSMKVYVSAVGAETKRMVEDTIARYFHASHITHGSASRTLMTAIGGYAVTDPRYIVVAVSEYATELTLAEHGVAVDAISFPIGTAHIESARAHTTLRHEVVQRERQPSHFADTGDQAARAHALVDWMRACDGALRDIEGAGVPTAIPMVIVVDPIWQTLIANGLRSYRVSRGAHPSDEHVSLFSSALYDRFYTKGSHVRSLPPLFIATSVIPEAHSASGALKKM